MASSLQKEIKKLSKLVQYRDKPKEYVSKIAQKNVTLKELADSGNFIDAKELKRAKTIFENYLETKDFTEFSELSTLSMLVYNRVLVERIQKTINNQVDKKNNFFLTDKVAKTLHDTENQVTTLEKKLGLDAVTAEESDLTALQRGKKQFHMWIQYNRNEYSTTCIAKDSLVSMADMTTKKIQDVKIGDEILGLEQVNYSWRMKKQKVLNSFCNGTREVLKMKAGNNELELTPDHRVLAEACRNKPGTDTRYYEVQQLWGRNLKVFNYIRNLDDYYKGVLYGFIDSDGHIRKTKDKKHPEWKFTDTYFIYQKNEHKAVEWLLDHLKLKHTKKWSPYSEFSDGAYAYRIICEHSAFIKNIRKNLLKNKDIQYGYLCGFMLGDGHRDRNNSWTIAQSYKVNQHKIDLLEKILKINKISYTTNISSKERQMLRINVGSCRIPLKCPESKKISTWTKHFLNCKPYYSLDRFKIRFVEIEKQKEVYDLTTETGNFIVNGFVVHNCSNCGFPLLLRRKCNEKYWDVIKHPFFSGRWMYNHRAMQDVKKKKITKEQYADYFHTSVDYVDWCLKNEGMILAINDIPKEDMQKFMKEKWYLKEFADKITE